MSLTNLLKALLFIVTAFAAVEITFTIQRYGIPKFELFEPKPGSCRILEEKYCTQAKIKEFNGKRYIGFNLPNGTPIYSFLNGERTAIPKVTAKNSPFFGQTQLLINTKDSNTFGIFTGRIKLSDNPTIIKGGVVAITEGGGNKILEDYNLIFSVDENSFKELFPKLQ